MYTKGCFGLHPEHLCYVYGGQRSDIGKIHSLPVSGLAVQQTSELKSVAEAELDLTPGPVYVVDIDSLDGGVGAEIEAMFTSGKVVEYEPYLLLEGLFFLLLGSGTRGSRWGRRGGGDGGVRGHASTGNFDIRLLFAMER